MKTLPDNLNLFSSGDAEARLRVSNLWEKNPPKMTQWHHLWDINKAAWISQVHENHLGCLREGDGPGEGGGAGEMAH